ncbi:MAG: hypothetical protein AABX59_02055, partial [Nanoarchaeota archaeon]
SRPRFFYGESVIKDSNRGEQRMNGYPGKAYFYSLLEYKGVESLTINEIELSDYLWVDEDGVPERLKTDRPEKAEVNRRAFTEALIQLRNA